MKIQTIEQKRKKAFAMLRTREAGKQSKCIACSANAFIDTWARDEFRALVENYDEANDAFIVRVCRERALVAAFNIPLEENESEPIDAIGRTVTLRVTCAV